MPWFGSEMERRLDELTTYWERVTASALGRGARPIVSTKLADYVAAQQAAFLQWREGLGGYYLAPGIEDEIRGWRKQADDLAELIRAEGVVTPSLPPWPKSSSLSDIKDVAVLAVGAALLFAWLRGRR